MLIEQKHFSRPNMTEFVLAKTTSTSGVYRQTKIVVFYFQITFFYIIVYFVDDDTCKSILVSMTYALFVIFFFPHSLTY